MYRFQDSALAAAVTALIGAAIILFFEWHTDEVLVVLPVLLIVCVAAGWIAPRWYVASGVLLGLSILAAHAASGATGIAPPHYLKQPPSTGDWVMMALLVLPALGAAFAGSRLAAATSGAPAG